MIDPSIAPVDIRLHKTSSELSITWADGIETILSGVSLRAHCACSRCRARNLIGTPLINDNANIESVAMAGVAGLQVIFADGHDKGVFPWAYLRAIDAGRAVEHLSS
ncbi:MAG: DUF971 domain-containing protein [Pseudomonadota bacterium]|nr:hypothetical protein [Pseudomonadales bacterium]MDY6921944.1 DUF971 domain-containing protein [Pseudomonadota bacterium]